MKICTCCKEDKELSEFSKSCRTKSGYNFQCKECIKIAKADWKSRNLEFALSQARIYSAEYRKKKPKQVAKAYANWAKKNRPYLNDKDARRKAKKINATPNWSNDFFIKEAYHLAKLRTKLLGIEYQVDHIVPLVSDKVSGLHNEHNLQVIPASVNHSKGNRWWPDMWED